MKNLALEIEKMDVSEGSVALWWLAQAGFVFKSASGKVIYLDPYLSDVVERVFGFKRLSISPIDAKDVRADWVLSSHEHLDHMDTDSLPAIASNNEACRFAGSESCRSEYDKCGISSDRLMIMTPRQVYDLDGVKVHTSRADHGELSPDALAMLFDFGKIKVMFTGDTAFNMTYLQPLIDLIPDVLIPCINGRFGNMNSEEAAELTSIVNPKIVIPCHFWMFKEHNGDPQSFVDACEKICPSVEIKLLTPGEGLVVD